MSDQSSSLPRIVKSGPLETSETGEQVSTIGACIDKQFSEFKDAPDMSDDDLSDTDLNEVERIFSSEDADNIGEQIESSDGDDNSTDEYVLHLLGEKSGNGSLIRKFEGWLGKDVLLQGKIYLTKKYLLFYAPMAPPSLDTVRASPLAKKSARMIPVIGRASYSRHWFVLRMGSFAWYSSSGDIYFPTGLIPLHSVVSVDIIPNAPEKFIIRCQDKKSYSFKADSKNTAHQWCKALKKEVFKARNHNVRPAAILRIPMNNIINAREGPILDIGRLLTLKALPDVYQPSPSNMPHPLDQAVSNYAFMFFGQGKESSAVVDAITSYTNHFANQKGVVFGTGAKDAMIERELSSFGPTVEGIFDTTPPSELQLFGAYTDEFEEESQPGKKAGSIAASLHPMSSNSTTTSRSESKASTGKNSSLSSSADSEDESGTQESSSKFGKLPGHGLFHGHHHKPLHLSKINVLSSLTSKLHINSDDSERSEPLSIGIPQQHLKESDILDEESDNEDDADSDLEDISVEPEGLGTKRYKKFFDDQIMPYAPHKVAKKLVPSRYSGANSGSTSVQSATTSASATPSVSGKSSPVQKERMLQDNEEVARINSWFRDHFGLDRDARLYAEYVCTLSSPSESSTWTGRLFISNHFLCFQRRNANSRRWRMVIPLRDITHVADVESNFIQLEVAETAYDALKISFSDLSMAKDAEDTLKYAMSHCRRKAENTDGGVDDASEARFLEYSLRSARLSTYEPSVATRLKHQIPPLIFDPNSTQFKEAFLQKPMKHLKFALMMIGSRGDVQPYIALSQGLMEEGHKCMIMSHKEFRPWVESFGIEFKEIAGDPSELMEIMISHGSISYGFVKDAFAHFKGWIKELMRTSWVAIKDSGADVLIESPSSMIGIHLAEALDIPYFRAFTMPWTRTKAYPQALVTSSQTKGGAYNSFTYVMYDRLVWFGISKFVNKWRKKQLGLPETTLDLLSQEDVPFLYCVSPTVLVPPLDQFDWVHSCGYWELRDNKNNKEKVIDPKLKEFIAKANERNKKLAYIGFGSIIVEDPVAMTRTVVEATKKAGVYCVLARGWSSRSAAKKDGKKKAKDDTPINEEHVFEVDSVDHQWLFPRMNVCVHHGGSGTTGASLHAGKPTIIKPFFGDQFFYASRVEDLNVGVNLKTLNTDGLTAALKKCVTDEQLIRQAAVVGEQIGHEHGVEEAILAIYQELNYAKDVTTRRRKQTKENAETGIFPDPKVLLQIPGLGIAKMGPDADLSSMSWFSLPKFGRREEQRREITRSGEVDVSL